MYKDIPKLIKLLHSYISSSCICKTFKRKNSKIASSKLKAVLSYPVFNPGFCLLFAIERHQSINDKYLKENEDDDDI
ncbi:CLUMA_CG005182, isoform A [Clunio marinus]|uniref:CLUMA_CG005182, isoform A n=1 Tax=Clunio marinus TaxID=568069 RepID=A0A1J1HZG1_9DIPT|nr:CLUMA_CG005182, isoform A [Clunio marinus]